MLEEGIFAGIDLSVFADEGLLVSVTEKRTREEMDRFVLLLSSF